MTELWDGIMKTIKFYELVSLSLKVKKTFTMSIISGKPVLLLDINLNTTNDNPSINWY